MSAPRKIWSAPSKGNGWNVAFCSEITPEDAKDRCEVYHHDDVVRELVEALERIADLSVIAASDMAVIALRKHRAALAKIAQEG